MQRFGRQFDRGVKQVLWLHGWLRSSTTATTLLLLVQSALAAVTASQVPVSQVTAADVVAAMTRQHLPAERVQVVFPASITATVDTPVLDVAQATMRDAKSANLRMVCAVHGECPSFYVVVRWAQAPGKHRDRSSQHVSETFEPCTDARPVADTACRRACHVADRSGEGTYPASGCVCAKWIGR